MFTYKYARPALTVDALVVAGKSDNFEILLIERKNEPFKNRWALPGGFVEMEETLMNSCLRELREETSLALNYMEQFRVYDAIDRDPRHRTISVVFYAFLEQPYPVKAMDDAVMAKWFNINELPDLAFDHNEIINLFLSEITDRLGTYAKKQV